MKPCPPCFGGKARHGFGVRCLTSFSTVPHLQEAVGHFGIGDDSLLVPQLLELPLGDQGVVARGVPGGGQEVQEHLGQPLDVQDDQVLGELGDAAGDHPLWAQVGEQLAFFSC